MPSCITESTSPCPLLVWSWDLLSNSTEILLWMQPDNLWAQSSLWKGHMLHTVWYRDYSSCEVVGIWFIKIWCTLREVIGCNVMVKDPIISLYFSLFQWMTALKFFRTLIQKTGFTTCPTGTTCGHCQKQSSWLSANILWHVNFSLSVMCWCAIQRTIFHLRIVGKDSTFIFSNNLQQDLMQRVQWQSSSWSLFVPQWAYVAQISYMCATLRHLLSECS